MTKLDEALGLFPSCIKSGENWSPTCQAVLDAAKQELADMRSQLGRANKIIGWMMPYIGRMCPPSGGLADLNEHCCENVVPEPGQDAGGRPIDQRPLTDEKNT